MTRWFRSLRAKLLVGHLAVIVVGAVTLMFVTRFTGPRLFELHVTAMGGHLPPGGPMGAIPAAMNAALSDALQQSLTQALLVGGLAALVAGVVVSVVITRQVVGPVQLLAAAAGHVAAGRYGERVLESDTTELALLTRSFNEMAEALEEGEQRRVRAHRRRRPRAAHPRTLEGYLEGLADGVEEPSEELWVLLRDETGRMRRLVEDMHELSRADAGQLPLTLSPVTPDAIVELTLARRSPDFAAKGLRLRTAVPTGLRAIQADRDRTIQVLTNLLTNALRYTPAGGEVEVSAAVEGAAVRFAVRDTGEGIASEHLPHVFERFYRVDASRSRTMGGSGVGLTIAKALVDRWAHHSGDLPRPGPRGPDASDGGPERAIFVPQLRWLLTSHVDGEPLAQHEVLHEEVLARPQRPSQQTEQQVQVKTHADLQSAIIPRSSRSISPR